MAAKVKEFDTTASAKSVAATMTRNAKSEKAAPESTASFLRDAVKTPAGIKLLAAAFQILARTSQNRDTKHPEQSMPFYCNRTALGNQGRMTDSDGGYHGHFKVNTRKAEKDADGNLTGPPALEKKDAKDASAPAKDVTADDALAALLRWANGRTMPLLGALLENDSVQIHASLSEAYETRAATIRKKEADASNGIAAIEEQEKQAAQG